MELRASRLSHSNKRKEIKLLSHPRNEKLVVVVVVGRHGHILRHHPDLSKI